jgi:UDP-2-acetamido-2,6-beta-L-arabino-hexul-4-ose reductase
MRIVVTGGNGFIGKNLRVRLAEAGFHDVVSISREMDASQLADVAGGCDFVFHLAGANRPPDIGDFARINVGLTETVCSALAATGRAIPIVYSSSTQAALENPYGASKREAERVLLRYAERTGSPVIVMRLTNVFGKWARPNYNSAVATFCHNVARGLPISINDPAAPVRLVYIDDVVDAMLAQLRDTPSGFTMPDVGPVYETTVGELAETIESFSASRQNLTVPRVGAGLTRALYATYVSYLPPETFTYELTRHADPRGVFVEMLRTVDSGQFSYFTAGPGITRGEHYHHTKTEKFLVVRGTARFGFRHLLTGETREIVTHGEKPCVVETVPGWIHNITNIGDGEMIVLLWANERFDPAKPDTIAAKVLQ